MKRFPLILALLWLFAAALTAAAAAAPSPLTIFVSVLPQKFFAERIAGEHGRVLVMVGPGKSPATYEPTSKQMVQLGEAKLYFSIGAPFEKVWLPKIAAANKGMKIVATGPVTSRPEEPAVEDGHGHGGEDPHIWTSPRSAMAIARTMVEALKETDGGNAHAYERRFEALVSELEVLDGEIARMIAPLPRRTFFVFHPAWGAFADAYGLEQAAIEQGGGEPGARHLAGLIDRARREKISVVFTQPQFDSRNAETVARAINGRVVTIDPLAEDYITNIKSVAEALAGALQ